MSAFVCNPEHIGQLASYLKRESRDRFGSAEDIAETMARENVRSVNYRYQEDDSAKSFLGMDVEAYVAECRKEARFAVEPLLKAVDIYKMAQCLDYQSCETSDYNQSETRKMVEWIQSHAIYNAPDYDKAVWEFHR